MKKYDKNDPIVRCAIYEAYKRHDFYQDGQPIPYKCLVIDHLLPQNLANDPKQIESLIEKGIIPDDFEMNSLINLVPTTKGKNDRKRGDLFTENALIFFLEQTKKMQIKIEKLIEQYSKKRNLEKSIYKLLPHTQDNPNLIDIIDDYISRPEQFSYEEFVSDTLIIKSTDKARLYGYLPSDSLLSGSCLILFNKLKIKDCFVTCSEPYISDILFTGYAQPYCSKQRKYVLFQNEYGEYFIQFGNIQMNVSANELKDVCELIDFYHEYYNQKMEHLKEKYGVNNFEMSPRTRGVYRLFKITISLWKKLLIFASKYDFELDNTEWNIFDRRNNIINVVSKEGDERFESSYHSHILSEPIEYDLNPTDQIWICWQPNSINQKQKFGFENIWTAKDTYDFLTEKVIPQVVYEAKNQNKLIKTNYNKFLSEFQIEDYIVLNI